MAFIGKRAGRIVARWDHRPTMMGVPPDKRTQDHDLTFEEVPDDDPDTQAFLDAQSERIRAVFTKPSAEQRLAALEAELATLKLARAGQ